jgi:hemoglobin
MNDRQSVYEFVGGGDALLKLATALNELCLADPVLNHPFSHPGHPDHLERLAGYLAEVFGGPPRYTALGGHSAMLNIHAGTGADDEFAERFLACFDQAVDDAGLPNDPELRHVLHDYMEWATREVTLYSPLGVSAPDNLAMPAWSWDGAITSTDE